MSQKHYLLLQLSQIYICEGPIQTGNLKLNTGIYVTHGCHQIELKQCRPSTVTVWLIELENMAMEVRLC